MFVELIESLRCPRAHDDTALVASATVSEHRRIVAGILGCPTCGAEFTIADGVAWFDAASPVPPPEPASTEVAMRLAAFLDLTDTRGFALLCGRWGAHASALYALTETPLVLVNPPAGADSPVVIGVIRTAGPIPLAPSIARAAAIDAMPEELLASAARAVRSGGRVVGHAGTALPPGLTELVRDEREWVAQKAQTTTEGAQRLVALKRGRR